MKQLHSNAPESKVSELFETIEQDLKCKVRQLGVPYQIATSNSESDDKIECHSTDSD